MTVVADYALFPDVEAIVIQELNAAGHPAVSALSKDPTYPVAVIKRLGGTPAEEHHLDYASLQVDCWGNDKADAADLAYAVRKALHELEGASVEGDFSAFITRVIDTLGISWNPDPVTDRARYLFGVGVYLTVPSET